MTKQELEDSFDEIIKIGVEAFEHERVGYGPNFVKNSENIYKRLRSEKDILIDNLGLQFDK